VSPSKLRYSHFQQWRMRVYMYLFVPVLFLEFVTMNCALLNVSMAIYNSIAPLYIFWSNFSYNIVETFFITLSKIINTLFPQGLLLMNRKDKKDPFSDLCDPELSLQVHLSIAYRVRIYLTIVSTILFLSAKSTCHFMKTFLRGHTLKICKQKSIFLTRLGVYPLLSRNLHKESSQRKKYFSYWNILWYNLIDLLNAHRIKKKIY